jgi:chemotaxis signal transduction protein
MQDYPDDSAGPQSTPDAHAAQDVQATIQETSELLLMQRGARTFAVLSVEADGVVEWRAPAPLPQALPAVLGVVSVRGRMLTLIDPLAVLDAQAVAANPTAGFIVALRGDEQLALAVDRVEGVSKFSNDEIKSDDEIKRHKILRGVIGHAVESISVINVNEIFGSAMRGIERRRRRS